MALNSPGWPWVASSALSTQHSGRLHPRLWLFSTLAAHGATGHLSGPTAILSTRPTRGGHTHLHRRPGRRGSAVLPSRSLR